MRYLLCCLILIQFILSCGSPRTRVSAIQENEKGDDVAASPDTVSFIDSVSGPPVPVPVKDWKGHTFLVLEKQQFFCRHGYELFAVSGSESNFPPDDSSVFERQNRIPCDGMSGHTLTALEVHEYGPEWLVKFSDPLTGKIVIGRTYHQAIKEIVPEADLIFAKKRWLNRFVFAKKGVISTLSEDRSGFGSIKVRIQDSLQVTDVVAGFTPLPVNPIWLIVKNPGGERGILPVRSSWTNIMSDRVSAGNPWDADIFEIDPAEIYSWDEAMWEIINNRRVVLEMTRDQVLLSWGEPVGREHAQFEEEKRERWTYAAQELYFDQNRLIAIENVQLKPGD